MSKLAHALLKGWKNKFQAYFPTRTFYVLQNCTKTGIKKFLDHIAKYSLKDDKNNKIFVAHRDRLVNQKLTLNLFIKKFMAYAKWAILERRPLKKPISKTHFPNLFHHHLNLNQLSYNSNFKIYLFYKFCFMYNEVSYIIIIIYRAENKSFDMNCT